MIQAEFLIFKFFYFTFYKICRLQNITYKMNQKSISSIFQKAKKLAQLQIKKSRPFKPVIISDIDGVLVRGSVPINQTLQAMLQIHQKKIPFACLTNGGGRLQRVKANGLNKYFKQDIFSGDYMFLNHTPLKPQIIRHSKMPGNIIISGSLNVIQIMQDLKISNFITADQLYAIYFKHEEKCNIHDEDHFHFFKRTLEKTQAEEKVFKRLGRKLSSFQQQADLVNSVFALNDVSPYETTITLIHNILLVKKNKKQTLSYYAAQNDVVWAGGYFKPRIAFGPFNYVLDEHCKRHKLDLIQHIYYGKPQLKAFQFVEKQMKKIQPNGVFFMMGDNPRADIRGANNIGWYSFLTRTGIHTSLQNDPNDPATFVVQNFYEAVQIILQTAKLLPR